MTSFQPRTPDQKRILLAQLPAHGSCVLGLPTGGGKTRMAAEFVKARPGTSLYLAPTKALAQSVYREWRELFPDRTVGLFDGDHPGTLAELEQAEIRVMTPERLDLCLRRPSMHERWLSGVGLCVVDEIHNLGTNRAKDDGRRSACLEGALICLQSLNPIVSILGLSATLENQFEVASWLEATYYRSLQRPVELYWETLLYRNTQDKLRVFLSKVRGIVADGYQVLVFCQSRSRCQDLATALQNAGIKADYHHAGRSESDRHAVELLYQAQDIQVLCATSTLAQGIGGPHNVIVYDLTRGRDRIRLQQDEVQQMAGRCGRLGDTEGIVTLMTHTNEQQLAAQYMTTGLKPVLSRLGQPGQLCERVLVAVEGGYATNVEQSERFFSRSLAAYQGMDLDLTGAIATLVETGVLTQDADGTLETTPIGSIAAQSMLPAPAVQLLVDSQQQACTYFDLLLILCLLPDFPLLPMRRAGLEAANAALAQEDSFLLSQPLAVDQLSDRVHTALVARLWTRLGDYGPTARRLGYDYPQEIEKTVSECRRVLAILETVDAEFPAPDDEGVSRNTQITALSYQLELGVDETLLELMQVEGVGPNKARRLRQAGIGTVADLAALLELPEIPGVTTDWLLGAIEKARSLAEPVSYRAGVPPGHTFRLKAVF